MWRSYLQYWLALPSISMFPEPVVFSLETSQAVNPWLLTRDPCLTGSPRNTCLIQIRRGTGSRFWVITPSTFLLPLCAGLTGENQEGLRHRACRYQSKWVHQGFFGTIWIIRVSSCYISALQISFWSLWSQSIYFKSRYTQVFFFHTSSDSLNCRGCISQPFDLRASALLCPETKLCPLSCFVLCPLHCPIMAELYRKNPPTSLTLSYCLILCVKYYKNVERRVFPLCLFLFVLFNFY